MAADNVAPTTFFLGVARPSDGLTVGDVRWALAERAPGTSSGRPRPTSGAGGLGVCDAASALLVACSR